MMLRYGERKEGKREGKEKERGSLFLPLGGGTARAVHFGKARGLSFTHATAARQSTGKEYSERMRKSKGST